VPEFLSCDPEDPPASELLGEMAEELNAMYWTRSRLDLPKVEPSEMCAPTGTYLVGWEGTRAVAGGGLRRFADGVAEIKRMFVRPSDRSRGIAGALLTELESAALALGYRVARLDTGPKQLHAIRLYEKAGYVPIDAYDDNPFACFWGEKELNRPSA